MLLMIVISLQSSEVILTMTFKANQSVCPPTLQSYQSFPESAAYDEHKVIDAEGTYSGK
jgi:hypothetical protein